MIYGSPNKEQGISHIYYKMIKTLLQKFHAPTPKVWRRIGNSILAVGIFVAGGSFLGFDQMKEIFTEGQVRTIIVVAGICGVLGKFITTFFTEDDQAPKP